MDPHIIPVLILPLVWALIAHSRRHNAAPKNDKPSGNDWT